MTVPELLEEPPAGYPGLSARGSGNAGRLMAASAVTLLMLVGAALRLVVAHQSLFADELSTYWIVGTHGLGGVISLLDGTYPGIPHAEITPPLFFLASWLTTQIGHAPELVRLPSLVAGVATIPLVYLVGLRTVGRPAALLAATFTTFSAFMIYYSAEARSYAVMMCLVTLCTLALLLALDRGKARWWAVYAVSAAAAFYTHYTCFFAILTLLLWTLWARPDARHPALVASLGAVILVLPWTPGLINDLRSPTTQILSALSPFTPLDVRVSLEHWAIGFPYVEGGGLADLPGTSALVLLACAAMVTLAGLATRVRSQDPRGVRACSQGPRGLRARLVSPTALVFVLALSVPVGEAIVSAISTHIFGVRNLAASWPFLALACAGMISWSGPRLRLIASALAVLAFLLGAAKMVTARFSRPDMRATARFIERVARPGDIVIDATGVLSPGPPTSLDVVLRAPGLVIRAGAPQERDHPYGLLDRKTSLREAAGEAVAAAHGGRIFLVTFERAVSPIGLFPSTYRLSAARVYHDFIPIAVEVWASGA